jgi:UDP-GlcNAc:undecaprenyl-phosphate GlcNAc-1-phosphate transferase
MTMIGKYPSDHPVSLLTPVFILGIPIFDTLFVMYIRYLRGLPVFWGSPDHIAIRLRHWGLTVPQIVIISYGCTAAVAGIGLLIMAVTEWTAWMLSGVTGLAFLIATWLLKKVEVARPHESVRACSEHKRVNVA